MKSSVEAGAMRVGTPLRAPRKYRCVRLAGNSCFVPPTEAGVQQQIAERVGDLLGLPHLTARFEPLGPEVWLCVFFHGADRPRHAATYEGNRPGSITYIPRHAVVVIVDWRHRLLYLAGPHPKRLGDLLPALNGTLFPERELARPFASAHFHLEPFRYLPPEARHPAGRSVPWRELTLKGYSSREAGVNGPLTRMVWPLDGFTALESGCVAWPAHLRTLLLGFRVAEGERLFLAEFAEGETELRVSLSPQTFTPVAELVALAGGSGTHG